MHTRHPCWLSSSGIATVAVWPTSNWRDLTDVIAVNPALDQDYLNLWAARLGVTPPLEKAFADVASDSFMP
jgi:hypothetical protein